jgi:hypothetical protein
VISPSGRIRPDGWVCPCTGLAIDGGSYVGAVDQDTTSHNHGRVVFAVSRRSRGSYRRDVAQLAASCGSRVEPERIHGERYAFRCSKSQVLVLLETHKSLNGIVDVVVGKRLVSVPTELIRARMAEQSAA